MKKVLIAAGAACALLAVPALAQAETSWYANIGYTNVNVDEVDVNLGLIQGRVGVNLNPYFAVEGEAGFGIADDTVDIGGTDVDIEMNSQFAAYIVGKYPVSERFDVYARVGYATYEVEASAGGGSASDNGSDVAYGLGAQAFFTDNDGVRFDWTTYGDADAWSLSYVRKF